MTIDVASTASGASSQSTQQTVRRRSDVSNNECCFKVAMLKHRQQSKDTAGDDVSPKLDRLSSMSNDSERRSVGEDDLAGQLWVHLNTGDAQVWGATAIEGTSAAATAFAPFSASTRSDNQIAELKNSNAVVAPPGTRRPPGSDGQTRHHRSLLPSDSLPKGADLTPDMPEGRGSSPEFHQGFDAPGTSGRGMIHIADIQRERRSISAVFHEAGLGTRDGPVDQLGEKEEFFSRGIDSHSVVRPGATDLNVSPSSSDLSPAQQIVKHVSAARHGPDLTGPPLSSLTTLRFRLEPETLGTIEVSLSMVGVKLQVKIKASETGTADLLRRDSVELDKLLRQITADASSSILNVSIETDGSLLQVDSFPTPKDSKPADHDFNGSGFKESATDDRKWQSPVKHVDRGLSPDEVEDIEPNSRGSRHLPGVVII